MTLPTSGTLSMSQINAEFGHGQKLSNYIGKTWYKSNGTTGKFTNPIAISDFYGKSKAMLINVVLSSGTKTTPYVIRPNAVGLGWNGTDPLDFTLTINAVQGTNTYNYAVADNASAGDPAFPAGSILRIVIGASGVISGRGGYGGDGGGGSYGWGDGFKGGGGGDALVIRKIPTTVNNLGVIQGGGGGGGGGGGNNDGSAHTAYGGTGGGGAGMVVGKSTGSGAGQDGTLTAGGNGGTGGGSSGNKAGNGGKGGAPGVAGSTGGAYSGSYGPGPGGAGGAAGKAVVGNSLITWIKTGTRKGAIT